MGLKKKTLETEEARLAIGNLEPLKATGFLTNEEVQEFSRANLKNQLIITMNNEEITMQILIIFYKI